MASDATAAAPARSANALLGAILMGAGEISPSELDDALDSQRRGGGRLGEILCRLGHVSVPALREALAAQRRVPRVGLDGRAVSEDALAAILPELALRHRILPLAIENGLLRLAMADVTDRDALETARLVSGKRIERVFVPEAELLDGIRKHYGSGVARMIAGLDAEPQERDSSADEQRLTTELTELAREPTVVNLVNLMISEAVEARASDIHIEPFEKVLKVKYRIDGVLHEMSPPPKRLQAAIISRVKIMAGMNIAERFVPQDGHISITAEHGGIDIRAATVPTVFGESVVLRLLDRSRGVISLESLGLNERCLASFAAMLTRPHGIVLVTGPTGSGKTTTLYAALSRIYTPEKKIITIEDPVEYQLEGVNQIPVNRKRGLGFADGLRAILRQDPDVIMVGEIRDRETADIAIRSALTGHLVFSTLHTNNASGAVTRLLDMGIEPFLLASSREGVLAQRLVRTICRECRRPHDPSPAMLERIGHRRAQDAAFFEGGGCRACRNTGYLGRTGLFELLRVTERVRETILHRGTTRQIEDAAPPDREPMIEDGYRKTLAGVTTLSDVFRVTQDALEEEQA